MVVGVDDREARLENFMRLHRHHRPRFVLAERQIQIFT